MGGMSGAMRCDMTKSIKKIEIFCDGASSNNQSAEDRVGGYGVLLRAYYDNDNHFEKELSGTVPFATNNQMEIFAVVKALSALKTTDLPIVVYSDSQYVVNTINLGWKRKANFEYWEALDDLIERFKNIEFRWVRGHYDNAGNIIADRLANNAINNYKNNLKKIVDNIKVV